MSVLIAIVGCGAVGAVAGLGAYRLENWLRARARVNARLHFVSTQEDESP